MPYIDSNYYNDVFKGEPASSPEELDKLISRASDLIDQVIGLYNVKFEQLPIFVQDLVKKATAYQVEFYIVNGYGSASVVDTGSRLNNVTIGSFSYSSGGSSSDFFGSARNIGRLSPSALSCLAATGLLNQTIDMFRGWC